ncbi:MAG: transcription/translation regulatory transformer protein RfaH [Magnetococcales bacterium]|nr:transcription/translation regulatory transformer protein RfaH [Magnetococcales bacterium]
MNHWYVVHTKPNQEQVARNNLINQGYTCFFPKVRVMRLRRNKRAPVAVPFFYSYLFINLDIENTNIGPIRSTFGVRGLVRFGGYYPVISDDFINQLYAMADAGDILSLPAKEFEPNQVVQIKGGPLCGYEAIFLAKNNKERALILIDIIGTKREISMPMSDLI